MLLIERADRVEKCAGFQHQFYKRNNQETCDHFRLDYARYIYEVCF